MASSDLGDSDGRVWRPYLGNRRRPGEEPVMGIVIRKIIDDALMITV